MSAAVDILNPERPKRIVIVASNPAVSEQTGVPIGFWWAELSHSFVELSERGYQVDIASPDGGALQGDSWSDPRDKSGCSAEDLISLVFLNSPAHMKLVEETNPLADVRVDDYDGALLAGGQGPMYTFFDDEGVHALVASFVGRRVQPFWIENEARKVPNTNFMVSGRFKPHAVRDGNLITGQQRYSGRAAARLMIEALGV